jgi:predicted GH43/DUF377 family glycosyl hydrolase
MAPKKVQKKKPTVARKKIIAAPKRGVKRPVAKKPVRRPKKDALLRAIQLASAQLNQKKEHQLERHENNPIVEPREDNFWEMKATFNPGAIYADNRVHLLYRAIGGDDVSVLGYTSSKDGVTFTERLDEPAYMPTVTNITEKREEKSAPLNPAYFSGGGWNGGVEDPRLTLIEDVVYLTYTAFDGWGSIRMALSSIGLDDFLKKDWKWKKPALISPPGEIHKNWVLFPEKINGKYAILHSIAPNVLVDYFDSLDDFDEEENVLRGSVRKMEVTEEGRWEHLVRGAGPPPIKTKDGWLVFYHAVDRRDSSRYKLGAMILDANDPTKVLYRARAPILEPEFPYENNGIKQGIVYTCGAIVKDGELYVYYGGADTVTCVAMANLDKFLQQLTSTGAPKLEPENKIKPQSPYGKR